MFFSLVFFLVFSFFHKSFTTFLLPHGPSTDHAIKSRASVKFPYSIGLLMLSRCVACTCNDCVNGCSRGHTRFARRHAAWSGWEHWRLRETYVDNGNIAGEATAGLGMPHLHREDVWLRIRRYYCAVHSINTPPLPPMAGNYPRRKRILVSSALNAQNIMRIHLR